MQLKVIIELQKFIFKNKFLKKKKASSSLRKMGLAKTGLS